MTGSQLTVFQEEAHGGQAAFPAVDLATQPGIWVRRQEWVVAGALQKMALVSCSVLHLLAGCPWASCKRPQKPQRPRVLTWTLRCVCFPSSSVASLSLNLWVLVGRDWIYHVGDYEQLTAGAQEMLEFYKLANPGRNSGKKLAGVWEYGESSSVVLCRTF